MIERLLSREITWFMHGGPVASPHAILAGSFNPLHRGHLELARVAERVGLPVAFELSVANVDKPMLDADEVRRRLAQFDVPVLVTRSPRFVDKAKLFPGSAFIVGADTAQRIVDPRYYVEDMLDHLATIRDCGCRFFVAGRVNSKGDFIAGDALAIPDNFHDLFTGLSEAEFRVDVSSTELRKAESPVRGRKTG